MLVNEDNKLQDFCNTNGFKNTITKGTRTNPITKFVTLLDVILCYCFNFFIASEVFKMPCSDHALVITVFDHLVVNCKPSNIQSRCIYDNKIIKLKQILSSALSISNFDIYKDVYDRWAALKAIILS